MSCCRRCCYCWRCTERTAYLVKFTEGRLSPELRALAQRPVGPGPRDTPTCWSVTFLRPFSWKDASNCLPKAIPSPGGGLFALGCGGGRNSKVSAGSGVVGMWVMLNEVENLSAAGQDEPSSPGDEDGAPASNAQSLETIAFKPSWSMLRGQLISSRRSVRVLPF